MDDLMNKVGALIEEYIEGETEARGLIKARNDTERLKGELRVQTQHSDLVSSTLETVRDILGAPPGAEFATDAARRVVKERDELKAERDKYRAMWKQLHRAQGEDLDAKEQFKELLGALGLAHFDRNTISSALEATRKRDARLVSERDEALAARDSARFASKVAHEQLAAVRCERDMLRERAQAADAKLFEVRNAAGEKAPAVDNERHYEGDELEGFRVGDLVQLRGMHPSHARWQTVTKLEEDGRVRYAPCDAYAPHMIARKPIEAGDAVRWKNEATRRDSRGMAKYVVTRVDDRHCWFGGRSAELCDVIAIAP